MNIFRESALWLVGMLPQPAPEWAIGSAVMIGIFMVLAAMLAISGAFAWLLSRSAP